MADPSDGEDEQPIPMPTWAREVEPTQRVPSQSWYGSPDAVVTERRRARSLAAWYAQAGMGHAIGLGYLELTLRELAGLSQSAIAARAKTSQPAITRTSACTI